MKKNYIALDMFAGGGGLTEGFIRQGFDFAAHIEMNEHAAKTLETRLCYHYLKQNKDLSHYADYYMGKINREELFDGINEPSIVTDSIVKHEINDESEKILIESIKKNLYEKYGRTDVDIVIGGPPCQAYSLAGRGRDKKGMKDDPRNYLYRHYISFLEAFEPEMFVFENVKGITSAKDQTIFPDIFLRCKMAGYHIDSEPRIINASKFGVLQNRERIIIIGWKEGSNYSYPEFKQSSLRGKVWDLLNDLPKQQAVKTNEDIFLPYVGECSEYARAAKIRNGFGGVRHHAARYHNERDREIYRRAIRKWKHGEGTRLKYNELPEHLQTHENKKDFLDRYKVVNGNDHSHAVLAHLAKDGHYFIHPDIKQARSLTVREAARLQSFPDDYFFEGPRSAKYTQIGNAVPPLMAEGIAGKIRKMLA
ncbi:DNA cytosine methyltransferase [Methanolacinia paynteri]|uniref:DNA cytosine methyltransferase n=1 Tax=Methanolacinia paynteri TaxID=230356 RepID=UPI00064EDD3D|nr:DNA cytosine methyltransferase [Methanolacinia paynteri]